MTRFSEGNHFDYRKVIDIGIDLSSALAYLHEEFHPEAVIIHRDLKPVRMSYHISVELLETYISV